MHPDAIIDNAELQIVDDVNKPRQYANEVIHDTTT